MFDENPKYSKKIQFSFLKKGLEKGEHGIYAMPEENDVIEKEMKNYGIDVDKYKKDNLLSVYQSPRVSHYPQEDPFDTLLRKISPFNTTVSHRIVGMVDFDMNTKKGMETFLQSEKKSDSIFHSFNGSWMCPYNTSNLPLENRINWIKELIKTHDTVIFTSSKGDGICFDLKQKQKNHL